MTDDLVKRLRKMSPELDMLSCEYVLQAADRIEELDAKLSNKVCPLGKQCDLTVAYIMGQADAAKAALKETKDE